MPKIAAEGIPGIVAGTAVRVEQTFAAVLLLVEQGLSQQGAMLLRSMFEDMVVMHWLVLHETESDYYVARLQAHRDAMVLAAARVDAAIGWPARADVTALLDRQDDLTTEFGRFAQRDWWSRDPSGRRLSLADLVREVGSAERFRGRTHGVTPVLNEHYQVVNKWATQYLHHTAVSLGVVRTSDTSVALSAPTPGQVLSPAYYVYAMSVCAALDINGDYPQRSPFWQEFMTGLTSIAALVGVSELPDVH